MSTMGGPAVKIGRGFLRNFLYALYCSFPEVKTSEN